MVNFRKFGYLFLLPTFFSDAMTPTDEHRRDPGLPVDAFFIRFVYCLLSVSEEEDPQRWRGGSEGYRGVRCNPFPAN